MLLPAPTKIEAIFFQCLKDVWVKKTKRKCLGTLSLKVSTRIRKKIEVKTEVSNWQGMVLKNIWMYTEGPAKTVLLVNTCKILSNCRVILL